MITSNGLFITFEGIEGSGKSTQIKLLAEFLKLHEIPVLLTREPGGPMISEAIRSVLLNPETPEMLPETELLLYMASRAQHTGEWIIPALKQGKVVLCDRYNDSTIAYQGAARALDQGFISSLASFSTFGLNPDLTVLIDLPVRIGLSRIKDRVLDRLECESIAFHEKVRQQYLSIAKKEPCRYLVLDGQKSPDELHQEIAAAWISFLNNRDKI